MANLKDVIRQMADNPANFCAKICKVCAVDREKRTADCQPLDGSAPFLDANLQADQESTRGLVLIPRADSYVVVIQTEQAQAAAIVLTDEIEEIICDTDQITLNGGTLGGLINIQALTDALNNLVSIFNSHTHANQGAAPPATTMQNLNADDYEDKTITH